MKRDVKTVADWNFERIIPCHGVRAIVALHPITRSNSLSLSQDVIEKDGNKAWREAFKWYLD